MVIFTDTTIDYKRNHTFTCNVDAYPPAVITWYKHDEKLHSDDDFVVSEDETQLTIPNMQPYQRGTYRCVAKNEYNENVYKFNLNISGVGKILMIYLFTRKLIDSGLFF